MLTHASLHTNIMCFFNTVKGWNSGVLS